MSFYVRQASDRDALTIRHFVAKASVDKLTEPVDWDSFLIAENDKNECVAIVAIEPVGEGNGLLRKLIVDTDKVTTYFLLEFVEAALQYAKEQKLESIYLLAAKTSSFLQQLGFTKCHENELPETLEAHDDITEHLSNDGPMYVHHFH
ncbi:hypothetical protein LGQ02_20020 [Bacillus shivajii]|uniref:GNAT family N-acetyltransferase n=1 Tax=Bacillus shivajii TaxID=1983719 RepID=UPI001CFAFABF|nr:hypothetical protein [Bacillus shivajii]UCZ53033.1 hypothetical protein LGQ02_20020 [Bacillus shivajii]